jgi:hypothetical protein
MAKKKQKRIYPPDPRTITTMNYFGRTLYHAYNVLSEEDVNGLIKEIELEEEPIVEQLYIEKTNDILYLYSQEDKTFLCQAKTVDELATLAKKYNNVKYAAVMIGEEIYAFVDGKVKTEKEIIK